MKPSSCLSSLPTKTWCPRSGPDGQIGDADRPVGGNRVIPPERTAAEEPDWSLAERSLVPGNEFDRIREPFVHVDRAAKDDGAVAVHPQRFVDPADIDDVPHRAQLRGDSPAIAIVLSCLLAAVTRIVLSTLLE
jgi:hypothetical protein